MFGKLVETFSQAVDGFKLTINKMFKEETRQMKGYLLKLEAFDKSGNLVYSHEGPNVVVDTASNLLALLLKESGQPGIQGIKYLALGQGAPGWNVMAPPSPTPDRPSLYREFARVPLTYSQFVNPSNGQPSETPTNVVDYVFAVSEGQAVGPIVECGMFGGPDATSTLGTGIMVNYRTFPVLNKTEDMNFYLVFRIKT